MSHSDESAELQSLAEQLLVAPFDAMLRCRYAQALLQAGQAPQALAQAELVLQQHPQQVLAAAVAAQALLAQDRKAEALSRYQTARLWPGFEPVDVLEALLQQAQPGAGPRLQLVSASAPQASVQSIQSVPAERVRFSSIVGMEDLKKSIRIKIIEPYLNPGLFARFRMNSGGGILLYGPPGCGKTMVARAVANECNAQFISVGISDVLNMWMGESERNLAAMFDKARSAVPCVLFFDELDALAFSRAKSSSNTTRTVVNEFLSQLDGVGRENRGILVLAATNMPWDVDDAMKRPGRFARQIFVPPPDLAARQEMLVSKLVGVPCGDLDFAQLATRIEHYSGADIDGLIELAKESAVADGLAGHERSLAASDFDFAMRQMRPSTLDWLRTVRNVVKYAGDDGSFAEVEQYLKRVKLL
jgi:SpoVK/Ycf46/Vps4 family AAA+-type ATPase